MGGIIPPIGIMLNKKAQIILQLHLPGKDESLIVRQHNNII